ncbi:MAG: hypothetical protein Q8T11_17615 [Elusimicrobiota bacterium]|nr:hypothetical protein [Elusimicrobiota bacterium]
MLNLILGTISGGLSGALLVWLLRNWISERLQQSIRHEYAQKLETHKSELNTRIQDLAHHNQLQQLRTSLFFDHQRDAFALMLEGIEQVNQQWVAAEYQDWEGMGGPVPRKAYESLQALFTKHQLFFDTACVAGIDLILRFYAESFPIYHGPEEPHARDADRPYEAVRFLQPRLAELFQSRIGVLTSRRAEFEIALLGGIWLINNHHFTDIDLPPKGELRIVDGCFGPGVANAVLIAEQNVGMLIAKLKEFNVHVRKDGYFFHEAAERAARYLEILESCRSAPVN